MGGESVASGYLGGQLGNKYGPKLFGKLGVPRLSSEQIAEYKNKQYPKYFPYLYDLYVLLIVFSAVIGMFLVMFAVTGLQEAYLAKGSLYFASTMGPFIVGFFTFFALIIFIAGGTGYALYSWGPQSFNDYMDYRNIQLGWDFVPMSSLHAAVKMGLVFLLILSPLLFFASRYYTAIYPDKVVANHFFSITDTEYPLSAIKNITLASEEDLKEKDIYIAEYITLQNGEKIEVVGDEKSLLKVAQQLHIPIELKRPSSQGMTLIVNNCKEVQEDFNTFYNLDLSIDPNANHCGWKYFPQQWNKIVKYVFPEL